MAVSVQDAEQRQRRVPLAIVVDQQVRRNDRYASVDSKCRLRRARLSKTHKTLDRPLEANAIIFRHLAARFSLKTRRISAMPESALTVTTNRVIESAMIRSWHSVLLRI